MVIANHKPIRVLGHADSSMTHEFLSEIQKTHEAEVMSYDQLLKLSNAQDFQYIVSQSWDWPQRMAITAFIDEQNLDLITVIHDTAVVGHSPKALIGDGSFVFAFSTLALGSSIGRHCVLAYHTLIGHYSQIGNNCLLRPGAMVNGKSRLGDRIIMETRSTVTAGVLIANDTRLLAFSTASKNLVVPGVYAGSPCKRLSATV